MTAAEHSTVHREIEQSLIRLGLLGSGDFVQMAPLTGGVSSDIWRVELATGKLCVKRALPQLRVTQLWEAPVTRNAYEVAWMQTVAGIVPEAAPKVLGHDPAAGLFVMEYLDHARHPLWKSQLRHGHAIAEFAGRVGHVIARIHSATASDAEVRRRFETDAIFYAIRLEPYLVATGTVHPDCAAALQSLVEVTLHNKKALVHGDVSPKNILVGPSSPVLLDAECAWYGDPAFDLAFCLNHLLLKCAWVPSATNAFLSCFDALGRRYLEGVTWEPREAIESRAARLLPGLFLARIDGKSPVEYLTEEFDKNRVRRVARALLLSPVDYLAAVRAAWQAELGL